MLKVSQLRGALLEEVLLDLLEHSGYRTVTTAGIDPTLKTGGAGLHVRGRGESHQIDAIADLRLSPPFSNPQRLLVEAKCYQARTPVDLPVLRNAVGVLKDVEEYWVPDPHHQPQRHRYHYQFAVFSASGYTKPAQRYAFAHNIYLITLAQSRFFEPTIEAIRKVGTTPVERAAIKELDLRQFRREFRRALKNKDLNFLAGESQTRFDENLRAVIRSSRKVHFSLLAMIGGQFPVFLVPSPELRASQLNDRYKIQIPIDDEAWYLRDQRTGDVLFSFDLPRELFEIYADREILGPRSAVELKQQTLRSFHAFVTEGDQVRLVWFDLDSTWLTNVRQRIEERR